ncbi:MAG: MBL fold metallo-hydrolase [Proteobacteria bacterium]|nr:MBL fold metallo-hydrolase [Pseudomonadota bacterium]
MHIEKFQLGPLGTNAYVLDNGHEAVAIDPGGNPEPMIAHLGGKTLTHILVTHLHFDHIYGVRALADATGATILAPSEDAFLMDTEVGRGGMMGLPLVNPFDFEAIGPGESEFLGYPCTVFQTPGHTPGSLSFYFPQAKAVFVGDLIFFRSVGRTDFPGGSASTLKQSVTENIFPLPPDTVIYSGHGAETTVGDEMNHNPFFSGY